MKLDKWLMRQLQPEFFDSWKKRKASQEINISNSGALQSVLQMFPLSLWRGGFALHTQQPDCWLKSILFKIKALAQKRRSYSCNGQKSDWEHWSWWAEGRGGGNAAGWRRGHCQGALESCWGFFLPFPSTSSIQRWVESSILKLKNAHDRVRKICRQTDTVLKERRRVHCRLEHTP